MWFEAGLGAVRERELPRCPVGVGKLELDSVDPVDAIDEEDQDEDECDLHSVLEFRY